MQVSTLSSECGIAGSKTCILYRMMGVSFKGDNAQLLNGV